ncbi:MAG: spermidine/putrescine ABC transporter substrate-binding protein [Caldilinea sp.]|nr:spermidine/putrescine ABC transporter substrate-binding protein [Caldilinea sp.]MDW8442779.1 spermidine/putrescine ABC transporter substrate-binding protein [Caldilineaceae bacterium]
MNQRRFWSALSALLIAALIGAACAAPAQAPATTGEPATGASDCPEPNPRLEVTSRQVNLFVWTEYIPQETIRCFEQVYGVRVNKDEYSSNEEMYAKLSAGGANYDLVQPTDYFVPLLIRQGLLQELDKSRLPILDSLDPNYLNLDFDPGNVYSIPYQAGTDAIIVNTAVVDPIPQSFADLWNPVYAGRLVMIDDSRAIIGATLLALGYDVNTTNPAELEEAKVKLAELARGIKLFDSDSPKTALIAGDVDLGIVWTGEAVIAKREVPSFEYIYPTEGAILWQDNYAIPKDAPNLDAAYAWLNYSMQGDVFWRMLEEFPYTNPNLAALEYAKENHPELYEEYINSNITNTPPEELQRGHRIRDVGDATPLYDRVWTEIKGG